MNIGGPQYSKAVKGLRNPVSITDQQFKLMFIYPILIDKSLSTYEADFRSFISVSILKELFISNSINMVNMASQVHPLTDERGKSFDTTKITGNIELSNSSRYSGNAEITSRSSDMDRNKEDIKHQIKKRTAVIKQLLNSDPRYSQYKPYLELITMDNFIDVPVIVGTKSYTIDTLTTMFVLLVAIANDGRLKLKDQKAIDEIFATIDATKEKDAWKLLNNVVALPPKEKGPILRWLLSQVNDAKIRIKPKLKELKSFAKTKAYAVPGVEFTVQKAREAKDLYTTLTKKQAPPEDADPVDTVVNLNKRFDNIDPEDAINILNIAKSDVDQVHLFFKFCVNPAAAKSMHGTSHDLGQISTVFNNKREDITNVFNNLVLRYMKAVDAYARPLITSYVYTFLPTSSTIDISNLIETKFLEPLFNSVKEISIDVLYKEIENNLGESSVDADANIRELKGLCSGEFKNLDSVASKLGSNMEMYKLSYGLGDSNKLEQFSTNLQDASTQAAAYTRTGEFALKKIIKTFNSLEPKLMTLLTTGLINIFQDLFVSEGNSDITLIPIYNALLVPADDSVIRKLTPAQKTEYIANGTLILNDDGITYSMRGMTSNTELFKYNEQLQTQIATYLYFLYIYSLQAALCELATVVDLSIEAAKNNVLEFPNYTLIVPIESIMAIANAFAAKGWKNLVSFDSSRQFYQSLNDNYTMGVVKYMAMRLGVPNIIIVDRKKGEVFFKLMYQSKPQKMKLDALLTYVKHSKEIELDSSSNTSSYF